MRGLLKLYHDRPHPDSGTKTHEWSPRCASVLHSAHLNPRATVTGPLASATGGPGVHLFVALALELFIEYASCKEETVSSANKKKRPDKGGKTY